MARAKAMALLKKRKPAAAARHVAFLRAINVAGHAVVKMEDLKEAFTAAGCRNVESYIQSGNVIYEAPATGHAALAGRILSRLSRLLGGEVVVIFRTLAHLADLVRADPFKGVPSGSDVKLYVVFLEKRPRSAPRFPLEDPKEALRASGMKGLEIFVVSGRTVKGSHGFPNAFIEKATGVAATSRNWNTITRIVDRFA